MTLPWISKEKEGGNKNSMEKILWCPMVKKSDIDL